MVQDEELCVVIMSLQHKELEVELSNLFWPFSASPTIPCCGGERVARRCHSKTTGSACGLRAEVACFCQRHTHTQMLVGCHFSKLSHNFGNILVDCVHISNSSLTLGTSSIPGTFFTGVFCMRHLEVERTATIVLSVVIIHGLGNSFWCFHWPLKETK